MCQASDPQPIFTIDTLFEHRFIEPTHLRMLADSTAKYSIENIQAQEFLSLDQFPTPNQRKRGAIYWTKMILENQLGIKQEFWLSVQADFSYGYLIKDSGGMEKSQAGIRMPFKEKTIQAHRHRLANYLPISLNPKEKATFFIKTRYPEGFPPIKEIHLIETPENVVLQYLKKRQEISFGNGFFQALLLILLLYCLFYAINSGERFAYMLTCYCLFMGMFF